MAEALLLMCMKCGDSFVLGQCLKSSSIRPTEKTFIETTHNLGKHSTVRLQTDPITIALLFAYADVAADAGHTDKRISETEDLFDLFNGHDLSKMDFLHSPGDDTGYHTPYESRCLLQTIHTLGIPCERFWG